MRLVHSPRLALAAVAVLAAAGCASVPPPTEQMAAAKAAVDSADATGAPAYAPTETRLAADKLAGAKKALADRDHVLARQLADESQLDAQLAVRKMQTAKSSQAADEARKAALTGGTP